MRFIDLIGHIYLKEGIIYFSGRTSESMNHEGKNWDDAPIEDVMTELFPISKEGEDIRLTMYEYESL